MPWKGEKNPYYIWLSEIILQQTRVEQGLPYFLKFKEKYPTVHDLANAEEDEVMKLWEGLGYYSRVKNLKKTAQIIIKDFNKSLPDNLLDLKSLPGIGDYTASAISAIAFNQQIIPLDGNIERVLKRYLYLKKDKEIVDIIDKAIEHLTKNNIQWELLSCFIVDINEKVEIFSIIKAKDAIDDSHVVILVLDAHEGVTEQDATLLGMIEDKGRALLIVINKWDGLDDYQKSEVKRKLDVKLSFVNYASVHYISALHGSGVGKLFAPIKKSFEHAGQRFPTSLLNKILEKANDAHQAPPVAGRRPRLKFVNQTDVFPPTLIFHGNHVTNIPNSYERFLKNFFIKSLKISNTPIKIEYKAGDNPFKDRKNTLSVRQVQKKRRLMKFVKKKKK